MAKIDRYIAATRFNLESQINSEIYQGIYLPPLKMISEEFGVDVEIRVAYSATRRAEHITFGENRWIIYDQYMGQTLNILNRVFMEAEDGEASTAYFHKVAAEKYLELGKLAAAFFCSKVYDSEREALKSKNVNDELRSLFTFVQETFYLNHELGHEIFRTGSPSRSAVYDHVVESLSEWKQAYCQTGLEELIARSKQAPAAAFHHQASEIVEQDLTEQFTSAEGKEYRQRYLDAFLDDSLLEEVFCDTLAADLTFAASSAVQAPSVSVLRAIYVGFYHLQALTFVETQLVQGESDNFDWKASFIPVQIRSHLLRRHLLYLFELHLVEHLSYQPIQADAATQELAVALMEDQKQYYDLIFDPAMTACGGLADQKDLTCRGESLVTELLPMERQSDETTRNLIIDLSTRLLTGWLRDRSSLEFMNSIDLSETLERFANKTGAGQQ